MSKKTPAQNLRRLTKKSEKLLANLIDLDNWFQYTFLVEARKNAKRGMYSISIEDIYPNYEEPQSVWHNVPFSQLNTYLQDKGFHYFGDGKTYMW